MRSFATAAILQLVVISTGCGSSQPTRPTTTAAAIELPEEVTGDTFGENLRLYESLGLDHPSRLGLRGRLVGYLDTLTPALLEEGDYDGVAEHFGRMTALLSPEDFDTDRVPEQLGRPARYLVEHGSPRGDEARVLSARMVLHVLYQDQPEHERDYSMIARWGREARETLPNPIERLSMLIDVWEQHAGLSPAPPVLAHLATLHVARRDAIVSLLHGEDGVLPMRLRAVSPHLIRRAPLDVAAVYLQHGDLVGAITRVEAMGEVSGTEQRLLQALREARDGDEALLELGELYRNARPEVSRGLCRLGLRRSPEVAEFPACLARVSATQERYVDATAWYALAIEHAPDTRELYDEALDQLNEFIEDGLFEADPSQARVMARHAERILEERSRRWPRTRPPVAPARLHYLVGALEMNAGNAAAARARLSRSLEEEESVETLQQLGLLMERTGEPREAARLYRRALDLTHAHDRAGVQNRAELLEHLGDAFGASGEGAQQERMYRQAVGLYDELIPTVDGVLGAHFLVRRGVLQDRLGRRDAAFADFRQAMAGAQNWREPYAVILSHLVVAPPDPALAHEVFRRAQRALTLAPEWKVYFALWVAAVCGRAGQAPERDVSQLLGEMARSQAWWGRLARFGAGELEYEQLLRDARGLGQQTEAHFYEGARLLSVGDGAAAQRQFQLVLQTHMVSFYEYAMAQALGAASATDPAPQSTAVP